MKKKVLLSFMAATAICAASAGSYAVWDNVTAASSGSINSVTSRINVEATAMSAFQETHELEKAPFYNANANFDLDSVETALQANMNFEITVSVKSDGTELSSRAYTLSVVPEGSSEITPTGNRFVDTNPNFETNKAVYGVKITLNDTEEAYALVGKKLDVVVTGTLVKI